MSLPSPAAPPPPPCLLGCARCLIVPTDQGDTQWPSSKHGFAVAQCERRATEAWGEGGLGHRPRDTAPQLNSFTT